MAPAITVKLYLYIHLVHTTRTCQLAWRTQLSPSTELRAVPIQLCICSVARSSEPPRAASTPTTHDRSHRCQGRRRCPWAGTSAYGARSLSEKNINGNAPPCFQLYCSEWHGDFLGALLLGLHLWAFSLLVTELKSWRRTRAWEILCRFRIFAALVPLPLQVPSN